MARLCSAILFFNFFAQLVIPEAGAEEASYDEKRFSATTLAEGFNRPLELDIAPDGRVFFIELEGRLNLYHPATGMTTLAAELKVFSKQEGGLLGLTLDPDFKNNQWIYLMYSPPSDVFVGNYVSRFQMKGEVLDTASEKVVLKVPTHRDDCCHHAGSLEFGPGGNLFIATGDNTHPSGDSGGYAPIDERKGKHVFDAQDTSGNTNDLRGKILRIRPTVDGSYTIPDGNLFPKDGPIKGLPEIYVMGCRNPWRIQIDQESGFLYWGEVGPDAGGEGKKGPRGYDELNQARAAGNFGWPFFIANNKPYADHDYVTGKTGALYDVERPMNISPTNTGSKLLPKPKSALIYYPYANSREFSILGSGGRTACAGPVYHFDPDLRSDVKMPRHLDRNLIFYDWQRPFIKRVVLDADSKIQSIEPFLTGIPIKRAVDMKIGPEGALYVLDYGSTWGANKDSRLLRIEYHAGNRPPIAKIEAKSPTVGKQPFKVMLSAANSSDPDPGDVLTYQWSVNPESAAPSSAGSADVEFLFSEAGEYVVSLRVTDKAGSSQSDTLRLVIGNTPPEVRFLNPVDGGFFDWGDDIEYSIVVTDAEDGSSNEFGEVMRRRLLLNHFVEVSQPGAKEAAYLSDLSKHAAGLSLIQQSDCLNCHAVEKRIIGPSFVEIATRYAEVKDQAGAVAASADRIIKGSSKVWGEVPMLPHARFSVEEASSMVRWIYSMGKEGKSGESVVQAFEGRMVSDRPAWMRDYRAGVAVWQASYTDFGAEKASAIAGRAEVRLRSRLVEAEQLSRREGTQTLGSKSASSGNFVGDISNSQYLVFDRVNLDGITRVTARVASPSTGGVIQLRKGTPGGALISELKFVATGGWEDWQETRGDIIKDPGGLIDLCVLFVNPKDAGPFMNLDWLRFDK